MTVVSQVRNFCVAHHLLEPGMKVIVTCSGGADSTALLHLLITLADHYLLKLFIAHVNYGLRGSESDRDEQFVTALGRQQNIPTYVQRVKPDQLRVKGLSLQMACRNIRYTYYQELGDQLQADRIALGHTLDDALETFLIRLLRGSGVTGLKGMVPLFKQRYIRPLLALSRQEILTYLQQHQYQYVEDSSNRTDSYQRNIVRHHVIEPLIQRVDFDLTKSFKRTLEIVRTENDYLEAEVRRLLKDSALITWQSGEAQITRTAFQNLHCALQRRLLLQIFHDLISPETVLAHPFTRIEEIINCCHGKNDSSKSFKVGRSLVVEITATQLKVMTRRSKKIETLAPTLLPIPGSLCWPEAQLRLKAEILPQKPSPQELNDIFANPNLALFDGQRLPDVLTVRSRQTGDRFKPFGFPGTMSVKKFLSNAKVPRERRELIPVVLAENEVIWIAGYRRAQSAPLTDQTQTWLLLRLKTFVDQT